MRQFTIDSFGVAAGGECCFRRTDASAITRDIIEQHHGRIEAENHVNVAESTTMRKGTGDKAVYHVDKKMIYVNGSPATMSDPSGPRGRLRRSSTIRRKTGAATSPP